MYAYSAPLTVSWTLTDLNDTDRRLKEIEGTVTEYSTLLRALRILAVAFPNSNEGFRALLTATYANLREVLRST
jgi:hypothetical protein